MQIVDAQLHEIGPRLKWASSDAATRHDVLTEVLFAWMDAVGIDAAIVNPRDSAWLERAIVQFPDRLAGVLHLKNQAASGAEEEVARLREVPGVVGHRLSFGKTPHDPTGEQGAARFRAGAFNGILAACQKYDRLLFCSAYGHVQHIADLARAYPGLRIVVDHMGIAQPPLNPRDAPPWRTLSGLLDLAGFPNVNVKLCGAPVLSEQGFPFSDSWPFVRRILDSFGVDRVMWASDIGRFQGRISWNNEFAVAQADYKGKHNYAESLHFILHTSELSASDKEALLGGVARRLTGWSPKYRTRTPATF